MMFCCKCGAQIDDAAIACPHCGCATSNYRNNAAYGGPDVVIQNYGYESDVSVKSRLIALLLCIFLGTFGIHRFYVGKIGTGILWLFTCGCFGIGYIVDLVLIACGWMRDGMGYRISCWEPA